MKIEEIFTFENLYKAYKDCRKSKQHKGEVIRFEVDLSRNISNLQKELLSKKYKLSKYKKFSIYEPKERVIEALPFKDRVVIKCFCEETLRDKIENKLIYDNAACRKNKGTDFAIKRLEKFLRHEFLIQKNNELKMIKSIVENLSTNSKNTVCYFESKINLRYIIFNVYSHDLIIPSTMSSTYV